MWVRPKRLETQYQIMRKESIFKLSVKFLPALLAWILFLVHSNVHAADGNILTKPQQWLENLSQGDQRIALTKFQIRLGEKVNDVLLNEKNAKGRLWSSKILMCGHELAASFATKNKDQQEAMSLMVDNLSYAIAGKGTAENRKLKIDEAIYANQKIANAITNDAVTVFERKHAAESEDINKTLTVAAMLCASADAIEKEQSACNSKGTDICKMARRMANDLAPQLPMQLSSQLSLQTVAAVKGNFLMTAKLEYDNTYLQSVIINSGISGDELIKTMRRHAKSGICQLSSSTKEFIDLGGVISYQYRFNNGGMYAQVDITSCP